MDIPDPNLVARNVIHLLGGRQEANKKIEREHAAIDKAWAQNAEIIGRILRGHLFVEHYLTKFLERENPQLKNLARVRLNFSQKIELVNTGSPVIDDLMPGIRHLNKVRNRVAHTLHGDVTQNDAQIFLGCGLFRAMRVESATATEKELSNEPIEILEDFSRYAGGAFQSVHSELSAAFGRAIEMAREQSPQ
ncbi:hypothetical protein NBRC116594_37430 [Shimia sp. NS0008-38b]|uniref:hypothetical protein n=1 Tax=Shimia sp. NS0008-38b TaxID=3127653 RepID=UPI00310AFD90